MRSVKYFLLDVGSTYTKLVAVDDCPGGLEIVGQSQSPTTLDDICLGVDLAVAGLRRSLGEEVVPEITLASSSAAGGLRMVAIGYMPRVTGKAAKEVSMSAGARVLEVLSYEDSQDLKVQALKESAPDIILLAGGTDGGDEHSLCDDAIAIATSGVPAKVILAGNARARRNAAQILADSGIEVVEVPNIMPTVHELRVKPAREAIHREFIRQITRAKGLSEFVARLSSGRVLPTPGAVLIAAELLARGTRRQKGLGALMVVDIGGATTDVHSVIPELDALPSELRGLVVANEKQASYRTVEGVLGLRSSSDGILDAVGPEAVLSRAGLADGADPDALIRYVSRIQADPSYLPKSALESAFDIGMAACALEVALRRHAGFFAAESDPVMGVVLGTPVGRDLRAVGLVIAEGGIFAALPEEQGTAIVRRALSERGISLLPESPRIVIDRKYVMHSIGTLSIIDSDGAFALAKRVMRLNGD